MGDCAVDVCSLNPNALDTTDITRHVPIGSGFVKTVRVFHLRNFLRLQLLDWTSLITAGSL